MTECDSGTILTTDPVRIVELMENLASRLRNDPDFAERFSRAVENVDAAATDCVNKV